MGVILSLNWKFSQRCSVSLWILELFLHGFLLLRLLRSKLQELFCRRNSIHMQLVLFLHPHNRHASSCLAAVPAFNFFVLSLNVTLQAWPSKVFVIAFKIISVTGRSTSSCFQFISLAGRFAVSYFVTLLPFNVISVVDHLAPSSYLVELFSRLIATLRVVLFAPLRFKIKLLWVKIALLRYSIQIDFCR